MIKDDRGELIPAEKFTPGQVLDSLRGVDCQGCGKPKRQWLSFCNRCYKKLPEARRRDLLLTRENGFNEAFIAALRQLTTDN